MPETTRPAEIDEPEPGDAHYLTAPVIIIVLGLVAIIALAVIFNQ